MGARSTFCDIQLCLSGSHLFQHHVPFTLRIHLKLQCEWSLVNERMNCLSRILNRTHIFLYTRKYTTFVVDICAILHAFVVVWLSSACDA